MRKYGQLWLLIGAVFYLSLGHVAHADVINDEESQLFDFKREYFFNGFVFKPKMLSFYQERTLVEQAMKGRDDNRFSLLFPITPIDISVLSHDYSLLFSAPLQAGLSDEVVGSPAIKHVTERVISINLPLSIVNMPIDIGVTPKFRQAKLIRPSGDMSSNAEGYRQGGKVEYTQSMNIDVQLTTMFSDELLLGIYGGNLLFQSQLFTENIYPRFGSTSSSVLTAGMVYDWNSMLFSTDLELYDHQYWNETTSSQFWRIGTGMNMFDWIEVNVDYYYDVTGNQNDIYSMGSEFRFGDKFSVDFYGIYSQSNHIEGLLRTSYDF